MLYIKYIQENNNNPSFLNKYFLLLKYIKTPKIIAIESIHIVSNDNNACSIILIDLIEAVRPRTVKILKMLEPIRF